MFIKTFNTNRETVLLNVDNIEMVIRQLDGDTFVRMLSGEHFKLTPKAYEEICNALQGEISDETEGPF